MGPMDFKRREEWDDLLGFFARQVRMPVCLSDDSGAQLLCKGEHYPLCTTIRRDRQFGQNVFCRANASMLRRVQETERPVLGLCEARLFRLVIPLFSGRQFVGQVAACGLACQEEKILPFLLSRQLGIREDEIKRLARGTPIGVEGEILGLAMALFDQLNAPDYRLAMPDFSHHAAF